MELPNQAHIVVGIPFCGRPVAPEWAMAMATQSYPLATNITYATCKGMEVGAARDYIVETAQQHNAPYIWFVDDDTAPPVGAIRALKYVMEQNPHAAIVGGVYCSKTEIPEPVVFRGKGAGSFWHWKIGDVFECDGIGTGCMLIRTEVFSKLEKPWFKTVDVACEDAKTFKIQQTDDLYFCDKVIAAGHKILAHGGVLCVHWDAQTGKPYMLPQDSYPVKT